MVLPQVPLLDVSILGEPQPAGSKRAFVNRNTGRAIVTDANAGSAEWKNRVAQAAQEEWGEGELLDQPLRLVLVFTAVRPRGHYRTDGVTLTTQGQRHPFPQSKPDLTKLIRAVEDALTGVVYRDDARITAQLAVKRYGDKPGVRIMLYHDDGGMP